MVIADTGPLYALIDRSDAWHQRVTAWWTQQAREVRVPVTVLPEVCYLLQTRISAQAEQALASAPEYWPAPHGVHVLALATAYCPAAQRAQAAAESPE